MKPMYVNANAPKVVVVGAGIVGASAAYFLAKQRIAVSLIDTAGPSAGATGSSDGAVSVASKQPGMMMTLAQKARAFYSQLASEGVLAGIYHPRPTFLISRTEEEMELLEVHAHDLRASGEETEIADSERLKRFVPGLSDAAIGGVVVWNDGHALGYEVTERLLSRSGVEIIRNCRCDAVATAGARVTGVYTSQGLVSADAIVVAAGLGSSRLLGLEDVLFARKGQIVITDRGGIGHAAFDGHLMAASYIAAKRRGSKTAPSRVGLVIDPLKTGQFLLGGTREDNRSDTGTDIESISQIVREAAALYPPLLARRVIRTFSGVRTATRDGLPIVGQHPTIENLVLATGFEGDGICLGPYTGKIVADIITDKVTEPEYSLLAPQRFLAERAAS
ncbi:MULTISPECIES: FAD-binding oxidoreductase [Hyphomicrobiales]|jgi:glycine/D-amino acid oxidase-like deaminating enzyme|nr:MULTISPECIES: FAD-binding oxidoreductase [Mesorhizobium]MBN9217120.1 FAD-binding oxidoreductase [Mesorhizobium sp.]